MDAVTVGTGLSSIIPVSKTWYLPSLPTEKYADNPGNLNETSSFN